MNQQTGKRTAMMRLTAWAIGLATSLLALAPAHAQEDTVGARVTYKFGAETQALDVSLDVITVKPLRDEPKVSAEAFLAKIMSQMCFGPLCCGREQLLN